VNALNSVVKSIAFGMKSTILFTAFCLLAIGWARGQTFVNFTVNQPPQLFAAAGADDIICPGDTAQLGGSPSASGGTAAYVYAWTGAGVLNPSASNPLAAPAATTPFVLTVTDANNCTSTDTIIITVDTCVGLPDPHFPIHLAVYPNPSNGRFKVVLDGDSQGESLTLQVTDLLGRSVEERPLGLLNGRLESEFALQVLAKGTYFLRVQVGDQAFQRQIILQ
jgi:hypothetical protein